MPSLTRSDHSVTATGAFVYTATETVKMLVKVICDEQGLFVSVFRAGTLVTNVLLSPNGHHFASLQNGDTVYAISVGGDAILKLIIEDAS